MPIRIDWIDPNGEGAAVNVHRSLTPINEASLPAPIATVNGASFYVDETVVRNQLYYYRLSSLGKAGSNETIITPNKPIAYMPYTGPGPQTLLRGDWECGYFGRMAMGSLIAESELIEWSGVAMTQTVPTVANEWIKMVYKGKIIFFPAVPIATMVKWSDLYKAGLTYGDAPSDQWPAYPKTTYGVIPQNKYISVKEHRFSVRMAGSRANPLSTSTATADLVGGEWDQFIAAVYRTRNLPDPAGRTRLDDLNPPQWCSFTQDISGGRCVNRGYTTYGDELYSTLNPDVQVADNGWRPFLILEL